MNCRKERPTHDAERAMQAAVCKRRERAPGPECGTMLAALAAQLGTSGLAELVASAVASARAKPLRIAYLCAQ